LLARACWFESGLGHHFPTTDPSAKTKQYAERLASSGVPVAYECCSGSIHGFMNMGRVLRRAHGSGRQLLAAWLVDRLHGAGE
jgi:acetyl esterase/lipase